MKRFILRIAYTVGPLWLIIVILNIYVSTVVYPELSGDLGYIGAIPFGKQYNAHIDSTAPTDTLMRTIGSSDELIDIHTDVLTIGDSFAQFRNLGFQNYMAMDGMDVANISSSMYYNPLQLAYDMLKSGLIDSTRVKVLVVESVERSLLSRVRTRNYKETVDADSLTEQVRQYLANHNLPRLAGNWELTRVRDHVLYLLGFDSSVRIADIDRPLFTHPSRQKLFFLDDDINQELSISSSEDSTNVKAMFQSLTSIAHMRGVKLILLIACDKYDLYQKHIIGNPFPSKTINEDLRRIIGPTPQLLLAKECLAPYVDSNMQDLYYINDTHWTCKAARIIASEIEFRLSQMNK